MKRSRFSTRVLMYFLIMLLAAIAIGCSSSKDATPQTISGVAAAGAPIIGTVTIKDSSSPAIVKTTTIAADGTYSIDVSGMTPPFALRADGNVGGKEYHLYSAAVSTDVNGTINITPFTDLIIANLAADIAENYYSSGDFSSMTADELAAAQAALQAKLLPILTALGLDAAIDLLRTSFNTDHTGLDAVIDVVKVTVDPGTVQATLTNVVNGEEVTVDIEAGGTTSDTFTGTGVAAGVTSLQAISDIFNTFTSLFATSVPAADNTTLVNLFDSSFLHSGQTRDAFLSDITSDPTMVGTSFTNIVLNSIDETAGTAEVSFIIKRGGLTESQTFQVIRTGGTWRLAGDGRIAHAQVKAEAHNYMGTLTTGLRLDIEDRGNIGIQSAVVNGPGLPSGGILLKWQISNNWFAISGGSSDGDNFYTMTSDTDIAAIPENAVYTVRFYTQASPVYLRQIKNIAVDTPAATYTYTVLKGPVTNTELASAGAAAFPTITAPTLTALNAYTGGDLVITWTLPTGLSSRRVELMISDSGSNTAHAEEDSPGATTTSVTLTIPAPSSWTVTNRGIYVTGVDVYERFYQVGLYPTS